MKALAELFLLAADTIETGVSIVAIMNRRIVENCSIENFMKSVQYYPGTYIMFTPCLFTPGDTGYNLQRFELWKVP